MRYCVPANKQATRKLALIREKDAVPFISYNVEGDDACRKHW